MRDKHRERRKQKDESRGFRAIGGISIYRKQNTALSSKNMAKNAGGIPPNALAMPSISIPTARLGTLTTHRQGSTWSAHPSTRSSGSRYPKLYVNAEVISLRPQSRQTKHARSRKGIRTIALGCAALAQHARGRDAAGIVHAGGAVGLFGRVARGVCEAALGLAIHGCLDRGGTRRGGGRGEEEEGRTIA